MTNKDRRLADMADEAPRRARWGPGIGGLLEDEESMADLFAENIRMKEEEFMKRVESGDLYWARMNLKERELYKRFYKQSPNRTPKYID